MDTVADTLTRIRNGYLARKERIEAPFSSLIEAVCQLMATHGYLDAVHMVTRQTRRGFAAKRLELVLRYHGGKPVLTGIRRISKLGRRQYARAGAIPNVLGGYGITIVTTSQGVMTDQEAREKHVGGEIVCSVW